MKSRKFLAMLLSLVMLIGLMAPTAMAEDTPVAKVGETEYTTIDEAIANWTKGTTLTLLADVTLSDVITIKSTEHHILNLGTNTMTAASGKNAIVIQACGTGSAERYAITITADATNPGGIDAGNKSVIYYKYADGGISADDRPIIKIEGGVFDGFTSSAGTAGIYTSGTAARKCATLNISGGTFNCSINGSGKSKLLISGGTFNYSVGSQGDSTCYRLISGGTFKTFGFMTADGYNTKFWIGNSMANSNVGLYVDDNGYLVVGGSVITEPGTTFEASTAKYSNWSSYLQYSSAKDNGLYYTSLEEAVSDAKSGTTISVYTDISSSHSFKVPTGVTLDCGANTTIDASSITLANGAKVDTQTQLASDKWPKADAYYKIVEIPNEDGSYTYTAVPMQYTITFDTAGGNEIAPITQDYNTSVTAPADPVREGYTFKGWSPKIPGKMPGGGSAHTAQWEINQCTITFDTAGGNEIAPITQDYNTSVTAPADPVREGYNFVGWDQVIPDTMPAEDMTITAQWAIKQYGVSFVTNGGTPVADKTLNHGSLLTVSEIPTQTNYLFEGWYSDPELTTAYDFSKPVTGPFTLYAKWVNFSYSYDNGSSDETDSSSPSSDSSKDEEEEALAEQLPFVDVPSNFWAYEEVSDVYVEGLMNGTSTTNFTPDGKVTRQQVWMILARMAEYNPADMTAARGWAMATDVSDGSAPGASVTRQQLVTLIWRAAGEPKGDVSVLTQYPDAVSVADYAKEAMAWAVENGVIGGTANGTLNPAGTVSRAQLAVILYRYVG